MSDYHILGTTIWKRGREVCQPASLRLTRQLFQTTKSKKIQKATTKQFHIILIYSITNLNEYEYDEIQVGNQATCYMLHAS